MKRRTPQKLSLHRETVTKLGTDQLQTVGGAVVEDKPSNSCAACSQYWTQCFCM
jgi:hypothetical protein